MKICFATNNRKKIEEVKAALGPEFELVSLQEVGCFDELPETGDTLDHNAFQKARYVKEHFGVDCFADDTGLEVEALNGAPGVYSGRFAGEPRSDERNIDLLLGKKGLAMIPFSRLWVLIGRLRSFLWKRKMKFPIGEKPLRYLQIFWAKENLEIELEKSANFVAHEEAFHRRDHWRFGLRKNSLFGATAQYFRTRGSLPDLTGQLLQT